MNAIRRERTITTRVDQRLKDIARSIALDQGSQSEAQLALCLCVLGHP